MTDPKRQRPIIAKRLVFRNPEGTQAVGHCYKMTLLCVENNVAAIPMLNPWVSYNLWTNVVDRHVAAIPELLPPVFEGLLIDMMFAALAGDRGGEHDERSMSR